MTVKWLNTIRYQHLLRLYKIHWHSNAITSKNWSAKTNFWLETNWIETTWYVWKAQQPCLPANQQAQTLVATPRSCEDGSDPPWRNTRKKQCWMGKQKQSKTGRECEIKLKSYKNPTRILLGCKFNHLLPEVGSVMGQSTCALNCLHASVNVKEYPN